MVEGIAATEIAKLVNDLGVTATLHMRTAGGILRPATGMHRSK